MFLSDIRLISGNGVCNEQRVATAFKDAKNRSYSVVLHSSKSGRGVGVALANNLQLNILEDKRETNEKYLLIKLEVNGKLMVIGSVYGPNRPDRGFFTNLTRDLLSLSNNKLIPIVVGGDWNLTWDSRGIADNIDTFQMASVPNLSNSNSLHLMCLELNLADPYRTLYPDKLDFTYQPFGTVRLNRSRIDFFIISQQIEGYITECSISSSVLCNLFDHKFITLSMGVQKPQKRESKLSNNFLDDPVFDICIKSTTYLC